LYEPTHFFPVQHTIFFQPKANFAGLAHVYFFLSELAHTEFAWTSPQTAEHLQLKINSAYLQSHNGKINILNQRFKYIIKSARTSIMTQIKIINSDQPYNAGPRTVVSQLARKGYSRPACTVFFVGGALADEASGKTPNII
jgi:hypothetical protein